MRNYSVGSPIDGDIKDARTFGGSVLPFTIGSLFFLNNFPGVEIGLAVLFVYNILSGQRNKFIYDAQLGSILFVLYLILLFGLMCNLIAGADSLVSVLSFISKFSVFFLISFSGYKLAQVESLISGYIVGAVLSAIAMVLNLFHVIDIPSGLDYVEIRQSAFMGDPNIVAAFLVFALLLAYQRVQNRIVSNNWYLSLFYHSTVFAILTGLILTFSRASWGNLVVVFAALFFTTKRKKTSSRVWLVLTLVSGLFIGSAALISSEYFDVWDLVSQRFDPDVLDEATGVRRSAQNTIGTQILGSNFFEFNFGHGSLSSSAVTGMNPHSTPYQLFYELGFFNFLLFILAGILGLIVAFRDSRGKGALFIVLFPCALGLAVNSLAVDIFYWRLFWLILALIVVNRQLLLISGQNGSLE